jgi:hypothetical protein
VTLLCLTPWTSMSGVVLWLHLFLTSALDRNRWLTTSGSRFIFEENIPRYPFNKGLGESLSRYGCFRQKKNALPCRNLKPERPGSSAVRILSTQTRVLALLSLLSEINTRLLLLLLEEMHVPCGRTASAVLPIMLSCDFRWRSMPQEY